MKVLKPFCVKTKGLIEEDIIHLLDLAVEAGANPHEGVVGWTNRVDTGFYYEATKYPYVGVDFDLDTVFETGDNTYNGKEITYTEAINYLYDVMLDKTLSGDGEDSSETTSEIPSMDVQEDFSNKVSNHATNNDIISETVLDTLKEVQLNLFISVDDGGVAYFLQDDDTLVEYKVETLAELKQVVEAIKVVRDFCVE